MAEPGRVAVLAALLLAAPCVARGGEAAEETRREFDLQMASLSRLPFYTPRQAYNDHSWIAITDGRGELPMPTKSGRILVAFTAEGMTVDPSGDGSGGSPQAVALPREGFSQPISVPLTYADGSTNVVALCFGRGGKPGELVVRNMTVAVGRAGGVPIYIVDDNCDGKYNEAGRDAVIAGTGRLAAPLGPTIVLGASAYGLQVAENGRKLAIRPLAVKLGAVRLSGGNGYEMLNGALVRGADRDCFALGPEANTLLPVGQYTMTLASLADGIGRLAAIRDGGLTVQVAEGEKPAMVVLTPPKLTLNMTYDSQTDQISVDAPRPKAITCNAGNFSYFFPVPHVRLLVHHEEAVGEDTKRALDLRLPVPNQGGLPERLSFPRLQYNLGLGLTYTFDVIWSVGVGPPPQGTATLTIPAKIPGRGNK